jgi:hypothetical protein
MHILEVVMLKLDKAALEAANTFLTAGALQKQFEKERTTAKATLVAALGDETEGLLPDGRRVTKTVTHFDEATYTRGAYDATQVAVSALSASDVQAELLKLVPVPARAIKAAVEAAKPKAKGRCK